MPGFDGTGPAGQGPMTGRGMGPCGGGEGSSRGRFEWRRGFGWGFGRGYGRGRGWFGLPWRFGSGEQMSLEEEEKTLEAELREVRKARKAEEK